jgi:hypothetical protein
MGLLSDFMVQWELASKVSCKVTNESSKEASNLCAGVAKLYKGNKSLGRS